MNTEAIPLVYFKCVREHDKLRIRIISGSYNIEANCQFPRNIRKEGGFYSAPASAIKFSRGSAGKFFYRVKASAIVVLPNNFTVPTEQPEGKVELKKVYEDGDSMCVICMDHDREVVIVPCGHYCMCRGCSDYLTSTSRKCPLCRGSVTMAVSRENIQT